MNFISDFFTEPPFSYRNCIHGNPAAVGMSKGLFIGGLLKLYAGVKERMEAMQQHNMSWIEVQFLKRAVDVLCQCRQTLMYTYVFAFYLRKNNQSMIFEV